MRTRSFGFVLCAGLALSACATIQPATDASKSRPAAALAAQGRPAPAAANACADWRWIGIKKSASDQCPTPGRGWTVKPLFEAGTKTCDCCSKEHQESYGHQRESRDQNGVSTADAVKELQRFCVYEAADPWKTPSEPPFRLPQAAGLVGLDRDCATISRASQDELTREDLENLSAIFVAEAGAPKQMSITKNGGVRLAFLDTEPTGVGVPPPPPPQPQPPELGPPRHGYTLAYMANRLVCSPDEPAACAALITTRLALPIREFDPESRSGTDIDTVQGGGIGMQTDLAEAIEAEVNDWHDHLADPGAPQHLVLNLSLGWDPQQVQHLDLQQIAELDTGTQAVYRALKYAKSFDVLVLAAAGNKRDCEPPSVGPLLPAKWESDAPSDRSPSASTPLVYAVGAVGSDNLRLFNARDGGIPKRVAYGDKGILAADKREEFTSTWLYTGSSVATAVVSAAAALVWDTVPQLSSGGVMGDLDAGGTPLPSLNAEFAYGNGGPPKARRISVCKALLHACNSFPGSSSDPLICPVSACPEAYHSSAQETYLAQLEQIPNNWTTPPLSTDCNPWVVPQPDEPLCPLCNMPYRP